MSPSDLSSPLIVRIKRVRPDQDGDLPIPRYMPPGASGVDLSAAVPENIVIAPNEIKLIPTGWAVSVPPGYEAQIRPRSGLALKHGLTLLNSPGTIDADYRGEIGLIVVNFGPNPYTIRRGDRIAQMIISRVFRADFEESSDLDDTTRNAGGFGHTGA
ncbi:MAG: dUTP diphosphatase [Deltaproteobacteria bacterium]|nr:dUTP diphosphatase [Deltaproteobacteria bacterium]